MQETSADASTSSPEPLWQIACDPVRVQALHGLVGDFCHLLRNRLNGLQMGLYLARRGASPGGAAVVWDELDGQYKEAERVVDLFQTVCRPMPLTSISVGLDLVLAEFASRWSSRFSKRGVTLSIGEVESDGPSRLDPSRLGQGLDALAGWRIERAEAGMTVHLRGRVGQGRSIIEWSEARAPQNDSLGILPLAALARVASVHGGSMRLDDRDGWRVHLDWPNAGPT